MKIAFIGSRGFLADYGGFETFVNNIALGLNARGYEITVYGIKRYRKVVADACFPQIRRIWITAPQVKFLEKVVATMLSLFHASFTKQRVILLTGVSGGLLLWLPRLMGKMVLVNVDGIEWQRSKWSPFVSFFLRLSELSAILFARRIIADSQNIARYVVGKYKSDPLFIPYGAGSNDDDKDNDLRILHSYHLRSREYFLQVCRLEPENNAHIVMHEFVKYNGDKDLAIVGDAPYSSEYKADLRKMANGKVKFLGAVYGERYRVLLRHAYCYIHGHEMGGTNPALLEAMAAGRCPIVLDVPYNREVIADCGLSFSKEPGDLLDKIEILDRNSALVRLCGKKAFTRVMRCYTWERVVDDYDKSLRALCT